MDSKGTYSLANLVLIIVGAASVAITVVGVVANIAVIKAVDARSPSKDQRGDESHPYNQVHSYIGTRMHRSGSGEANNNICQVPGQGEAERNS